MKTTKSLAFSILLLSSVILALAATKKENSYTKTHLPSSSKYTLKNSTAFVAQTQTIIDVSADTYLYGRSTTAPTNAYTTNYGGSAEIVLKYTQDNNYNRIGMLKFDLSGIDPNKGRITKAELQLFIKSTDAINIDNTNNNRQRFDATPFIVSYLKDDGWDANAVTWDNYLAYAQSAGEVARVMGNQIPYTSTGTDTWAVPPNQKITWDIAETVRKDYVNDAGKILSLTLSSTAVNVNKGLTLHSKENGNANYIPRLVITQESDTPFSLPEDLAPDYDKIMQNIRTVLYDEAGNFNTVRANAQNYLNNIQPNGSWSDLTYTGDVPTTHLDRLKTMALAHTNSQSSLYGNTALYTAIVNAIQWWYDKNPIHSNWYSNQISYPQRIGEILVLMRNGTQKLPAILELNTLYRMKTNGGAPDQSGSQGTGANKMNIAMHWIYRGCLAEDQAVLDKGVQQVFLPLTLTTAEGLQQDYSYQQHGPQLYIGGYGWDIVNVATRVALYTVATSYAQGNTDLNNLGIFLRQTYLRVIRGQNFMFNAFGRGIARPNGVSQSGFGTLLKRMKVIEPAYTAIYDAAIARLNSSQPASYGVEAAHTHFYRSDYTLQTKPGYTFELRTVSTRSYRNENGNGENIIGYFLSDGATSIAVTGTEYYNIFPTWDWSMIPGTTTRKGTMPTKPAEYGTKGNTTFVGGVSDTTRGGVSVYDLDNNSTKAKKAWFFFNDEIVCLGAGIATTAGSQEVVTTLNQCLLQSDVITSTTGGVVDTYSGNNTSLDYSNNLEWAVQGNVGYVLPNGGNVGLTAKAQTGKWSTINTSASTDDVTQNVFTLWLKHGVSPNNANYAYIVVPNISSTAQMQNYVAKNNIQILNNTDQVQAVRHQTLNLHSFVFYTNNQTYANDTISVSTDKPCLLMVQPLANGKLKLNVADPTKTLTAVTLNIKWTGASAASQVTVNLPTATEYAGKSVVAYLTPDNALPLKLLSFNAKRTTNGINLKWTTTNEVNTENIELWRRERRDGEEANSTPVLVGKLKTYNHTGNNSYSYVDKTAGNNELYYQLKVIDKDGSISSVSDFALVAKLTAEATVYPNPTNHYLYLKTDRKQTVKLFNNIGSLLLETTLANNQPLDISKYPAGVYYLKTVDKTVKFIINK